MVLDNEISIYTLNNEDYICITDIARYKDPDNTDNLIRNWIKKPQYHRISRNMEASEQSGF
jgi:hypothetical protein